MPPCISPGVQVLSRDTSISLTGNVHLNVGPFWAALRRPYCSAPQGELAPSSPRCAGIDLTFSCVIGLWTHYNPQPGVCQDFFTAIKNQRPQGRKREKPVTRQQFFSENRKSHRQTAQYLESDKKGVKFFINQRQIVTCVIFYFDKRETEVLRWRKNAGKLVK